MGRIGRAVKNPLIYILPARGMAFPDRLISPEGLRGELANAARFVQWRLAAGLVLYAIVSAALIDDAWPILALVVLRLGVDGRNARRRCAQLGLQAAIAVIGFLEHDLLTAGLSVGGELLIVLSVVVRRFCGAQINWLGSGFAAPLGTNKLPALDTSGEPTATAAVAITTAQAVLEERGAEDTPARLDVASLLIEQALWILGKPTPSVGLIYFLPNDTLEARLSLAKEALVAASAACGTDMGETLIKLREAFDSIRLAGFLCESARTSPIEHERS